jgi:hypothetical protein
MDLSLSKDRSGTVTRFYEQVILRIERDGKLHCNIAFSRAEAVHVASALREAAMPGIAPIQVDTLH